MKPHKKVYRLKSKEKTIRCGVYLPRNPWDFPISKEGLKIMAADIEGDITIINPEGEEFVMTGFNYEREYRQLCQDRPVEGIFRIIPSRNVTTVCISSLDSNFLDIEYKDMNRGSSFIAQEEMVVVVVRGNIDELGDRGESELVQEGQTVTCGQNGTQIAIIK